MTTKREAALAVQAAKARLGVTWAQLAEAVGAPLVWTTAALLGQHPMNVAQAQAAASMLELDQDVAQALEAQPTRGALDAAVPVDPTIYRFYEVLQVYGPTIKELIHEQRVPIRLVTALWSPSTGSFFPTSGESSALFGSRTMLL
jgi:cyanate lyase